jgi:hypothetical protein
LPAPPQDQHLLGRIAVILGLSEDSKERELLFVDYAAIDADRIPKYVLEDAEPAKRLFLHES